MAQFGLYRQVISFQMKTFHTIAPTLKTLDDRDVLSLLNVAGGSRAIRKSSASIPEVFMEILTVGALYGNPLIGYPALEEYSSLLVHNIAYAYHMGRFSDADAYSLLERWKNMTSLPFWQEKFSRANRSGGLLKDGLYYYSYHHTSPLDLILNQDANLQWYLSTYGVDDQGEDSNRLSIYWRMALHFRRALVPYIAGRCLLLTKAGGVGLMPEAY